MQRKNIWNIYEVTLRLKYRNITFIFIRVFVNLTKVLYIEIFSPTNWLQYLVIFFSTGDNTGIHIFFLQCYPYLNSFSSFNKLNCLHSTRPKKLNMYTRSVFELIYSKNSSKNMINYLIVSLSEISWHLYPIYQLTSHMARHSYDFPLKLSLYGSVEWWIECM